MAVSMEERRTLEQDPLYQLYMSSGGGGRKIPGSILPAIWYGQQQPRVPRPAGFADWRTGLMGALNAAGGAFGTPPAAGTPVSNAPLTPIWGQQPGSGLPASTNPIPAYTPPARNDMAGALPGFTKQKVNQLQQGQGFAQLLNGG